MWFESLSAKVVRLDSLNYFNYTTIITMFDVVSIMDGTTVFIREFAILEKTKQYALKNKKENKKCLNSTK